jgi:hypothetical protein
VVKEKVLLEYKQIIDAFKSNFDNLSVKADYESNKQMILLGILETMKAFKILDFPDAETRKIVKAELK